MKDVTKKLGDSSLFGITRYVVRFHLVLHASRSVFVASGETYVYVKCKFHAILAPVSRRRHVHCQDQCSGSAAMDIGSMPSPERFTLSLFEGR